MDENLTKEERKKQRFETWMAKLKEREEEMYAIVKPVIDKFDPEQLLALGCPTDEYDKTCQRIASGIVREGSNQMTVEALSNLMAFVWHHDFRMWGKEVKYPAIFTDIALELHPLLPEHVI